MSSFTVEVTDNSASWLQKQEITMQRGLRKMGMAVINLATLTTPRKDGPLRESGHIEGMGNTIDCVFGDNNVRYAKVQEDGHRGRVYFTHYTTPGTGPNFLENAGNTIAKKGIEPYL